MIFLDPTSDMAFKKLFGSTAHKAILIDFLNAVLERKLGEKIVESTLSISLPGVALREAWVDVRCTDERGNQYIIEVQVEKQSNYAARAQYYSSLALSRQLSKTEQYAQLVPVIFVGILEFNLFETDEYNSHHYILDNKTYAHELKHVEFHFIELKKFTKQLDQLVTLLDKWIYFLKNADSLHVIPDTFKENPVLNEAFTLVEQGNWSKKELDEYDAYIDSLRSAENILETAHNDGLNKGKLEGQLEEKIAIAKNLLDVLDSKTIAKKTGLTEKQVEELKTKN